MEYTEHDLVRIAKRELNTKRPYLVADPLQGKHIPSSPSASLALFTALADTFRDAYPGERLLLIGFAETATAIGAQAAVSLGTAYIQTTREAIPDAEYLFFSEEHSHATEQKLVKNDMDAVMPHTDRIVFIEDEVTTGKTILNIISVLERVYPKGPAFSIASVLNGMPTENVLACEERGIRFHYILKTDHSDYAEKAAVFSGSGNYHDGVEKTPEPVPTLTVRGRMDARRLVDAAAYEEACCGTLSAGQPGRPRAGRSSSSARRNLCIRRCSSAKNWRRRAIRSSATPPPGAPSQPARKKDIPSTTGMSSEACTTAGEKPSYMKSIHTTKFLS